MAAEWKGYEIKVALPAEIPPELMAAIAGLIKSGGVPPAQVEANLARAFAIVWATRAGELAGSVTLKHPRAEYQQWVMRETGLDLSEALERGYTSVAPAHAGQGLASELVRRLSLAAGERPLYVIIAEDNLAAQKVSLHNGTVKAAVYMSPVLSKPVGLWMTPGDLARVRPQAAGRTAEKS